MIDREIMSELKKKKSKSSIYRDIEKIREGVGYKISKEDAAYLLAGDYGIDIAKLLSKSELKNLRDLEHLRDSKMKVVSETKRKKREKKEKEIKILGTTTIKPNKYLTSRKIKQSKYMAEVYLQFYLIENLLRKLIVKTLGGEQKDWWKKSVSSKIRSGARDRMENEGINRWHSKRGKKPIYYTNFGDLRRIIINNWGCFEEIFPNQAWVKSRLNDLEQSRNIIAHNNPLPSTERQRIEMYFHDFINQLKV